MPPLALPRGPGRECWAASRAGGEGDREVDGPPRFVDSEDRSAAVNR